MAYRALPRIKAASRRPAPNGGPRAAPRRSAPIWRRPAALRWRSAPLRWPAAYGGPGGPPPYQGPQGQYGSVRLSVLRLDSPVGAYLVDVAPIIVLEVIILPFNNVYLIPAVDRRARLHDLQPLDPGRSGPEPRQEGRRHAAAQRGDRPADRHAERVPPRHLPLRRQHHLLVGYLFPLWDAKRQTLADKIMRTVVVPA